MIEVKMNEYDRVLLARITLVTAMSLLGGLSIGITYAQFLQQGEWLLYQNVTYGVSMLYPSNWTQQNSTGDVDDRFIDVSDFFSPEEETDGYFASVTIAIDSMPPSTNLEDNLNESIDIYRQDPEFQEFQLLSSSMGNFTLAGMPAYSFEIAYTDLEFGPQNMLEVGRIFDNRVYYIQYFADAPIYQKYLPIAERMIESFQIMQQQQQ
jgi:eukaryotic-like serine/threonine-protein kinase